MMHSFWSGHIILSQCLPTVTQFPPVTQFPHENFQILKRADKVSFHQNISFKMKKLQTYISFGSKNRKLMLMLFIVLFSVVTSFSNFQATFLMISPKLFGICTSNFTTKVRKIWQNFWYQNQSRFEKNWGDDVVDHVRHF